MPGAHGEQLMMLQLGMDGPMGDESVRPSFEASPGPSGPPSMTVLTPTPSPDQVRAAAHAGLQRPQATQLGGVVPHGGGGGGGRGDRFTDLQVIYNHPRKGGRRGGGGGGAGPRKSVSQGQLEQVRAELGARNGPTWRVHPGRDARRAPRRAWQRLGGMDQGHRARPPPPRRRLFADPCSCGAACGVRSCEPS